MSHNTFGHLFRVTTWGESHGPAIGCVVDGCPPMIPLTEADLQPWLDQRKPGGSRFVTQRKESDTARILSGVFDDGDGPVTTGTPISIMIENEDQRSKDYGEIARAYRPGHADYAYQAKYGVRDHRGGGRSSARETASRVAAGAVARKVPSIVFTEIPADRGGAFDAVVAEVMATPGPDRYRHLPLLTGRIVRLKGAPVDVDALPQGERWAFDQDILLSALAGAPDDANVVSGKWWAADYAGPPQIALSRDLAKAADLKVGDSLTLQLLGREMDVRIAALRRTEAGGFGTNFLLVLNAAAIRGANPRSVAIARASPAEERALTKALGADFREVNIISIREQLEAAATLFDRLALAIRGAAAVAGLAGLLVLIGAIAAGVRERAREAAVLKVLGGSHAQILTAYLVEYSLVGAIAGLAGILLGAAGAWPVVTLAFKATWSVDWTGVVLLLTSATGVAALGGGVAALHALSRRPAPVLRSD